MSRWNELDYESQSYPLRPRGKAKGGLLAGLAKATFALGAVAVVGGAVYLGVRHAAGVTDEASLPLIKADPRPLKSKPETPGGMAVPDQDKLVFDRLAPEEAPPMVEHLLPPPEQPLPRPVAPPPPPPPPAAATPPAEPARIAAAPTRADSPPSPQPPTKSDGQGASQAANQGSQVAPTATTPGAAPPIGGTPDGTGGTTTKPATPAKPATAAKEPAAKPGATAATGAKPAATATTGAKPAVTATAPKPPAVAPLATAKPATTATTPATAGGGALRLQLGSLHSDADAHNEWKRLQHKFQPILAGLSPIVVRADLGEKGVFYRLQAGPVDEARAHAICIELQSQQVGCQLVHR
jgi:hypothetical protein